MAVKARARLADVLFILLLWWPLVHLAGCKTFGFSSWRFFGWGMYATPHAEGARIDLFFSADPARPADKTNPIDDPNDDGCLGVWTIDATGVPRALSTKALCEDGAFAEDLSRALQFRSHKALSNLIKSAEASLRPGYPASSLSITSQRLSVLKSFVYLEKRRYRVSGDAVEKLPNRR